MSRERTERRQREVLRLYDEALASFGRRVQAVARNQWQAPTPCAAWSVRELVNHLTAEQLRAPELLLGATPAELGDRFEGRCWARTRPPTGPGPWPAPARRSACRTRWR